MSCNFCDKLEGLLKVDHPLNGSKSPNKGPTAGMYAAFGRTKLIQLYRCQMCQEYIMHIKTSTAFAGAFGVTTSPAAKETIEYVGWDLDKIKEPE